MTTVDLRCTTQTRLLGEHPGGSAGGADRYLLVTLPLPWPADIADHPLLAGLADVDGPLPVGRTRLLGVTPAFDDGAPTVADGVELVVHARSAGSATFSRWTGQAAPVDLATAVAAIRAGDLGALQPDDDPPIEVLVCAHGTRDRCCGSAGTRLALDLAGDSGINGETAGETAGGRPMRVLRASHLGGHRFAPTALLFPAGIGVAHVDAGHVRALAGRTAHPAEMERHVRGWLGLVDPVAQRADVAALSALGWGWWGLARTATVGGDEDEPVVTLTREDGAVVTVQLRCTEAFPVPVCGQTLDAATKEAAGFDVVSVDVSPAGGRPPVD